MAGSDSTVSEMGGFVDSGEVWSVHSVNWEISSDETNPKETLGERVDYFPISHRTHRGLARRDKPETDDYEREDAIVKEDLEEEDLEEDPVEEEPLEDEDSEEDPVEEEPMGDENPTEDPMEEELEPLEEEPMEWEFEIAKELVHGEILEGIPLVWELDMDEDGAREDELMVEDPAGGDELEEISLDGSEPQPSEDSDSKSTSCSSSASS